MEGSGRSHRCCRVLLVAAPAWADDSPDVTKLAGVVRWSGVLFSIFVIVGAMVALRVVGEPLRAASLERSRTAGRPSRRWSRSFASRSTSSRSAWVSRSASSSTPTTLTVIGGSLAVAIGLSLQNLVSSFIAGITIMFDRPFQVGDRVAFAGQYGDIIKIGLRSTRMNTLDHNIITIPNNKVLTEVPSSGNWGALEMQTAFDIYIGVDQDAELAAELIREVCLTSPYVFLERPVPVLAKQVILQDYVAMHLKCRPYVFDCKYEKPFETDVHLRVARAFREHGIRPPAVLHRPLDAPPAAEPKPRLS